MKIIGKSPHLWPKKIIIYGNSCIILYITVYTDVSAPNGAGTVLTTQLDMISFNLVKTYP